MVLIDQEGMHTHMHISLAHTLSPVRRGDAVAPRIGFVQRKPAGGKREKWKSDEYRLEWIEAVWRSLNCRAGKRETTEGRRGRSMCLSCWRRLTGLRSSKRRT